MPHKASSSQQANGTVPLFQHKSMESILYEVAIQARSNASLDCKLPLTWCHVASRIINTAIIPHYQNVLHTHALGQQKQSVSSNQLARRLVYATYVIAYLLDQLIFSPPPRFGSIPIARSDRPAGRQVLSPLVGTISCAIAPPWSCFLAGSLWGSQTLRTPHETLSLSWVCRLSTQMYHQISPFILRDALSLPAQKFNHQKVGEARLRALAS